MSYSGSPLHERKAWIFEIPREHGAVAIFSLATLVSLFLCRSDLTPISAALILLWLMMTSSHDGTLLFIVTGLSMLLMCAGGYYLVALFYLLAFLGIEVTQTSKSAEDLWWREIVGLSGAALAPLSIAALISGNFQSVLCAAVALLASTMTGLCLIHACRPELKVNPLLSAGLSLFLWISLAALSPVLTLVSLIPYGLQVLWILKRKRPYFKQLGLAQAACLGLVSLAILLLR